MSGAWIRVRSEIRTRATKTILSSHPSARVIKYLDPKRVQTLKNPTTKRNHVSIWTILLLSFTMSGLSLISHILGVGRETMRSRLQCVRYADDRCPRSCMKPLASSLMRKRRIHRRPSVDLTDRSVTFLRGNLIARKLAASANPGWAACLHCPDHRHRYTLRLRSAS